MNRVVLKLLNGIYGWIISSLVMVSAVYAGYSIWDNSQIYKSAENVQDQIRQLKPDENAKDGPGFDELRALNGDVVGWITVDGTNIDYPVLQGETNLTYMNKDVYGDFSLAGSIFLDVRNQRDFSDNYSLIYGHNMDEHLMFGDLALFKEKDFFQKNTSATLMVPGESRKLRVAAVLQIPAGTEEIFNPDKWKDNLDGLGKYLEENSIWYHQELINQLKNSPDRMEAVSLVTCSDGSTNDRTVLILVRENPKKPQNPQNPDTPGGNDTNGGDDISGNGTPGNSTAGGTSGDDIYGNGPKKTGDTQNRDLWMYLIGGIILFIIGFETVDRIREKRHKD
ncbi:class B sortase [Blautia sp. HCP3S3_H10_1]|uniref:class B sortase n=1 Tax=unclassified Blautia TaxID=2648079 RepID=UPI003F9110B7